MTEVAGLGSTLPEEAWKDVDCGLCGKVTASRTQTCRSELMVTVRAGVEPARLSPRRRCSAFFSLATRDPLAVGRDGRPLTSPTRMRSCRSARAWEVVVAAGLLNR